MRQQFRGFTADLLGEATLSEPEALAYVEQYRQLVGILGRRALSWPEIAQIDRDDRGSLPKANVSIKISALCAQIHPADPAAAIEQLSQRLLPILVQAAQLNVFINFDMEQTSLKDVTLQLFRALLDRPELSFDASFAASPRAVSQRTMRRFYASSPACRGVHGKARITAMCGEPQRPSCWQFSS